MSEIPGASTRSKLSGRSPSEVVRLAWRKAVHRKVIMGRYGVPTAMSEAPPRPCPFEIEFWGPDRYDAVLGTSPYLTDEDLESFRRQHSTCIVVLDSDQIVASSWMTNGQVFVHELQRTVEVPASEHFSCRSYVDDDHRGMSLLSHMIHAYSVVQPPGDEVWGLVYDWNLSSVRSLERIGWRRAGDYWTSWWFDRPFPGERRYPPRPPTVP